MNWGCIPNFLLESGQWFRSFHISWLSFSSLRYITPLWLTGSRPGPVNSKRARRRTYLACKQIKSMSLLRVGFSQWQLCSVTLLSVGLQSWAFFLFSHSEACVFPLVVWLSSNQKEVPSPTPESAANSHGSTLQLLSRSTTTCLLIIHKAAEDDTESFISPNLTSLKFWERSVGKCCSDICFRLKGFLKVFLFLTF